MVFLTAGVQMCSQKRAPAGYTWARFSTKLGAIEMESETLAGELSMNPILDTLEVRWSRALSRWALGTGLVLLGVLVAFAVIMTASAGGALPPEYDELVGAIRLPALYRAATALDVAEWLGLGGFFALAAAAFARRAPLRSILIAGCGVGQLAGTIGAFIRLAG